MTQAIPPKVALSHRHLGPIEVLRLGRANALSIIPAQALESPFIGGRTIWQWYHISGPEQMRHVLVENAENYPRSPLVRRVLAPALRRSMILAEGEDHAWQKRLLSPHFHKTASVSQVGMFLDCALQHASTLPPSRAFRMDALDYMVGLTLTVILRAVCSLEGAYDGDQLRETFDRYLDDVVRVSPLDYLRLPSGLAAALKPGRSRNLARARKEIDIIVSQRLAEGARRRADLMQSLIDAVDPATGLSMPVNQIRNNILLMIFAGHETTANTLAWAILLLAGRPDLQNAIHAELGAIHLAEARNIVSDTPVLDAVLSETMRLYPGAPLLIRQVRRSSRVAGCPVRQGAFMFVPLYALHRNAKLWDNPDSFCPERFLPGAKPAHGPYQYLPFAAGPRGCIGATFAQIEMRTLLADFLQRFRFRSAPGHAQPSPEAVLTLKPEGGVWIDVERRGRASH